MSIKKLVLSISVGLAIAFVSVPIVSTFSGESFLALDADSMAIVLSSAAAASLVTYGDTAITGILLGVIFTLVSSLLASLDHDVLAPITYVSGLSLGFLVHRFPRQTTGVGFVLLLLLVVKYRALQITSVRL